MADAAQRNAFEALCLLASEERWCWNILCTTCAHGPFRASFSEIARGRHPDSEPWYVGRRGAKLNPEERERVLRGAPTRGHVDNVEALHDILLDTNVQRIAQNNPFPDWLGYLGLGLYYTERHDRRLRLMGHRAVSTLWAKQLQELVIPDGTCVHMLGAMAEGPMVLNWQALGSVEKEVAPEYRNHRDPPDHPRTMTAEELAAFLEKQARKE